MAAAFAAAPVLTGVLIASTVVTVGLGTFAAIQSAKAAKEQAAAEQQRQDQLGLQAQQRANEIRELEIETLAAINVGAAASGIDPFSGAPNVSAAGVRAKANRQLRTARLDAAFGIDQSASRERQIRLRGRADLIGGIGGAVAGAASTSGQIATVG